MANGKLASLHIQDQKFYKIIEQKNSVASYSQDLSLEDWIFSQQEAASVDAKGALIVPAGIDCHVHSRDPGYPEKETWQSLSQAAFKGGVTGLVDMPNTLPPTMYRQDVLQKSKLAKESGLDFRLLLGVGQENIPLLKELLTDRNLPLAGIKVYYGQSTGNLMCDDLDAIARNLPPDYDGMLVFHSEDQCRIDARTNRFQTETEDTTAASYKIHSHIRDSQTAWNSTKTILAWAEKYKKNIHLAHVSTPTEIDLLDAVRAKGLKPSCEISPHHLLFNTNDYSRLGSKIKVNPPVRSAAEVSKLKEKLAEGRIDCFGTDHAPHTIQEKGMPYHKCPSGIPSIELFWPLLLKLAEMCELPLTHFVNLGTSTPANLFGFKKKGSIKEGFSADFVWLKEEPFELKIEDIHAKCGWSPYIGTRFPGRVAATWKAAKCVFFEKTKTDQ